ncbi:hypothetical protein PV689_05700 [Streptomyces sp. ATCC51928]|uniref:Large membrane protein n=1 Tax=Streptomyces caviscabies TaxID=90079 RepID=A0ABW2M8T7_9ACTN|nr:MULTISPECIES: hypothetical protein [Streptomyces]MDX3337961.1 hypothetical protein [Streptomyces sp. ME02-6979.5a]MDX3501403.1 hypothetical protein [Streptomyces sp. ATCC51928]MDX5521479.1 hypothetical protein [Streptomyces sp. DE06-01C]
MSTERPDNDVTGPRRRRPPLAVASVAAAVLLAGGGGAYWASTASGDGGRADSGAAAKGEAPPLALDAAADGPDRAASSSDTPPPGIAPGEPDPGGPPVTYRAEGDLPDGPDEAAVHHAKGTVASADVARLAKALGIPGSPRTEGASWVVGDDDGPGALLKVTKQAPGTWTFARTTPTTPCEPGKMCANGPAEPGGDPVSEKAAKAAAVPVLKAAGQDDAALNAGQLMGDVRVVNADPKIDGLPTYGWSTGVQVGPDGKVTGGSGHLKALEKGATYPTVGADEALKQLNAASKGKGDASGDIGGCATPVPLEGEQKSPSDPQCVPSNGKRAPVTQTVEGAVFGLALNYVDGRQTLVPSWLFTVRQAPGGPEHTVTQVAVDPEFIEKPQTPTPSGDRKVTSYGADGRTLDVTFWGGVCSTYTASAQESAGQVRISVTEKPQEGKKACIMIAKELTRTVTLEKPLGDRTVIDAASGGAVPRG